MIWIHGKSGKGKGTGVHKLQKSLYRRKEYNKQLQGNNLEFFFVGLTVTMELLTHTLSIALTLLATKGTIIHHHFLMNALSCIYTEF